MAHAEMNAADALARAMASEEIKQAKARYCRGVDTKDWDRFGSAFAVNATFEMRGLQFGTDPVTGERRVNGTVAADVLESLTAGVEWPIVGRDQIVAFCRVAMEPVTSAHHVYAPEIGFESDTEASVVWPMEDYTWYPAGAPVSAMHGFGHYHETYELTDEGWRIATLRLSRLRVDWR